MRCGCPVKDVPWMTCPEGLWIEEHRLVEGEWVHPDDKPTDPEGEAYCRRTDGACSGRACWACVPNFFEETA